MERTHDELRSLIAPYVLGAVPEDEVAAIRAHIVTCEECMAEAERFAEATTSLALLIGDEEDLPSGFADKVIAQVRPPAEAPAPRARVWWRNVFAATTVVLLIAVGALGALLLDARSDANDRQALTEAVVTAAPGVELDGDVAESAKLLTGLDQATFIATGIDEAPSGKTYQLWFIEDGTPVSAGTFDPRDGVAVLRVPQEFETGSAAAVTIEPTGGSDQPTTDPILASG